MQGLIVSSDDGTNWVERFVSRALEGQFNGLACGQGRVVAVGNAMTAVSTDGFNWMETLLAGFNDVAFGGKTFVAVGPSPRVASSSDGLNWTERNTGASNWLSGVAFGNHTFVVVGDQILQSDAVVTLSLSVTSPAQLEITGPTGRVYRVEYTDAIPATNQWLVLTNVVVSSNPHSVIDPAFTNSAQRFYRAVLSP